MISTYELRPYRPGDEAQIVRGFNRVFAEGDPDFVPRELADWRWGHAMNPAGQRIWVALHEGQVVAHYASQPIRMLVDGQATTFAQIVDSFVLPEHRRGLKRPGLFVETARHMLAETCGVEAGRDLVTYGWPNPQAWRIGQSFLGYEIVRMQTSLSKEPGPGSTETPIGVERLERADDGVNRLYERCRSRFGASAVRDATFLNWRLFAGPRRGYELYVLRDGRGDWAGYAVYRQNDFPVAHIGWLVDWLVPEGALDEARILIEAVEARARRMRARALVAMFPEWSSWFTSFQELGFRVRGTPFLMSARNNEPRHDMAWLREHWWYQPIELDLI